MRAARIAAGVVVAAGLATAATLGVTASTTDAVPQAAAEQRLATVDIFRAVRLSMASDAVDEAREAKEQELRGRLEELNQRIGQHEQKLQNLAPGDPDLPPTQAAYQADLRQMNLLQQQVQAEFGTFMSQQGTDAYIRAHQAATELARERGYTHLFASSLNLGSLRGEAGFDIENMTQLSQEVLARPVLMAPEADDLTDELIDKLGLAGEVEEEAGRAAERRNSGRLPGAGGG